MTKYRTGNKNARNIYRVDPDGSEHHIGCMFTEVDGRLVVAALNGDVGRARAEGAAEELRQIADAYDEWHEDTVRRIKAGEGGHRGLITAYALRDQLRWRADELDGGKS